MKRTYIVTLLLLLLALINANAQEQDPRWELTQLIEIEIETYIEENIKSFQLSTGDLQSLTKDQHHENLSKIELENIISTTKKDRLRDLYFISNPNNADLFLYESIENNSKQNQQNCFNGSFENGSLGYNFFNDVEWNHPGGINVNFNANVQIDPNTGSNFTPSFVSPILNDITANVSFVSPGNDLTLFNDGAILPRVPNPNITNQRAIRLNPVMNPEHATILTRQFIIDEPILSLNFAVAFENPNHPVDQNPFVRFEAYDLTTNTLVDSRVITSINSGSCIITIPNSQWRYTPWSCLDLDVSQSIGHNVEFRAIISDCIFTAHDAILYLDDICNNGNVCNSSLFGSLFLNPVNINCPTDSFQVCGTFSNPTCVIGNPTITLDIVDSNGFTIPVSVNPTISNNNGTFCFTVNPSDFGVNPSGNYEFLATAVFGSGQQAITIQDNDANVGADVSFINCPNPCDPITNTSVNGHTLNWDDTGDCENNDPCYTIEFFNDGNCCELPGPMNSATFTSNTNSFNLWDAIIGLQSKCFRYRIKTSCSDWSSWCCLAPTENGYELVEDCIPSNVCENYDNLINLTHPDDDVLNNETENHIEYFNIEATNIIIAGGTSTFIANETITLSAGFHAEKDSSFHAYILSCTSLTERASANRISNISKLDLNEHLKIFPNPVENELTIVSTKLALSQFELYNIQGKLLLNSAISNNKQTINVQNFPEGLYVLKITLENNETIHKKIIIK